MAQTDLCGCQPTRSWVKKSKQKQATKRYRTNKQARACGLAPTQDHNGAPKRAKKQLSPKPPKYVRKREQALLEREAKRLHVKREREQRKREQEEHPRQKQWEREERQREQEHKRERRLRAREEREQERLRRWQWHEQIKYERERCLARKQERVARRASAAVTKPSALSTIFVDDEALAPLPKPP